MGIWYCSREDVSAALSANETSYSAAQIDRACESAARSVEALLHRKFYPEFATRTFNYPNSQSPTPWRLWLDANELVSLDSIVSGSQSLSTANAYLEPNNYGPPYSHIELLRGSPTTFSVGDSPQRSISITGTFGYQIRETQATTLDSGVNDPIDTVIYTTASTLGVGSLIRIGDERMVVTGKQWVSTGDAADLNVSNAANSFGVANGSSYSVGEVLVVGAERLLIQDIVGDSLVVQRAYSGSVLATHIGDAVYAQRALTVEREVLGSDAGVHLQGEPVYRFDFPADVRSLAIAEAINQLMQEGAAYGRTIGGGDYQMEARGAGLGDIRERAYTSCGRKVRSRGV